MSRTYPCDGPEAIAPILLMKTRLLARTSATTIVAWADEDDMGSISVMKT
jgi:hypothetical protein